MSRETVHYGYAVESSLPLITDATLFEPLEEDLKKEWADLCRKERETFCIIRLVKRKSFT